MMPMPEGQHTGSPIADHSALHDQWARAISIASGRPTTAAAADQRRRRNRFWTVLVTFMVVALAAGVTAGLVLGPSTESESPSPTRENLQLTMSLLALALIVAGIVVGVRAGQFGGPWRAAISVLDRSQRRQVRRTILGRQELDPQHPERLPVHLDLASRLAQPWGFLLIMFGVALNTIAQVAGGDAPPWMPVIAVVLVATYAVALVFILRDQRAAQRFMDKHSHASGDDDRAIQ